MGNRAVITDRECRVGIYLHWNGGRDSIEGFLAYCRMKNYRPPERDNYGWARLVQVIANFFGDDGLCVGFDTIDRLDCDNYDNGTYIIEDWKIVDRRYFEWEEQSVYPIEKMMVSIDECQPHPVGEEAIRAWLIKEGLVRG